MPTYEIFRPRINNKDMRPEFYDNSYQVQYPIHGPDMANPYNLASTNDLGRISAYLWGRWWETITYPPTNKVWGSVAGTQLGYIEEYKNGNYNTGGYWTFLYWANPAIFNYTSVITGDVYTYQHADQLGRPVPPDDIGQIVTFIDRNSQVYFGGVVEYFNSSNDYIISYLDTTTGAWPNPEPVKLIHVYNNTYLGMTGQAIASYYSLMDPNINPRVIGKPIGAGTLPLLYSKRIQDIRKGNTIA